MGSGKACHGPVGGMWVHSGTLVGGLRAGWGGHLSTPWGRGRHSLGLLCVPGASPAAVTHLRAFLPPLVLQRQARQTLCHHHPVRPGLESGLATLWAARFQGLFVFHGFRMSESNSPSLSFYLCPTPFHGKSAFVPLVHEKGTTLPRKNALGSSSWKVAKHIILIILGGVCFFWGAPQGLQLWGLLGLGAGGS